MAKKLIRPNDTKNNRTDGELIPSIINGNCVLIVGSEIILSKEEFPEYGGDSQKMIFENLREWLIESDIISKEHQAQTFTQLSKDIKNIDGHVKGLLEDTTNFPFSEMSSSLVELIRTRHFRMVLTTTIDPYIYNLMHEVWGDELRVMDINSSKWDDSFDFDYELSADGLTPPPPTLYYVFGKAFPKSSNTRFALTDNDYIETISKWMGKNAPNKLLNYIHSKRIVALGCKFDDWFFRFFWYMLRGTVQGLTDGEVAISLAPQSETDCKLREYFEYSKIHFEPDARAFIKNTLSLIAQHQNEEEQQIRMQRREGEVFLSYAHEDFDLVKKIFYRLTESGIRVWFDSAKMQGGNDYDTEIRQAIARCRIFIPVLSRQVQSDLLNGNSRYYKDLEWSEAQVHHHVGNMEIVPIKLPGYDERNAEIIGKLPDCMRSRTVFDLERQRIDSLIEIIHTTLNR